jgi:proliferating cell nuclear antigen PCNA
MVKVLIEHEQVTFFKGIVEAIKDIVSEAMFCVKKEGLYINTVDQHNVALVYCFLDKSEFSKFEFVPDEGETEVQLGISLVDFYKIIKCCMPKEYMRLTVTPSKPNVIKVASRGSSFNLKLIDLDLQIFQLPEFAADYIESIDCAKFTQVMKGLSQFGETVQFYRNENGLFLSSGDGNHDDACMEVPTVLDYSVDYKELYSIKYMLDFCKGSCLSDSVRLKLQRSMPICLEYTFGKGDEESGKATSKVLYFMAPKTIQDD